MTWHTREATGRAGDVEETPGILQAARSRRRGFVNLPWGDIQALVRALRAQFFTSHRPGGTYLRLDSGVTAQAVREALGQQYYGPHWEQSYYKRGEVLNLAQVGWEEEKWRQTHVRAWYNDTVEALELGAHWELEPTEHPVGHLKEHGFNRNRGMQNLRESLRRAGLDFESIRWHRNPK